jgi:Xaa-Pro dipeptidase
VGDDIRVWQEDESPYQRIVEGLRDRGVSTGRVAIDDGARFFVFDGVRKLAPKLDYSAASPVLKLGGAGGR